MPQFFGTPAPFLDQASSFGQGLGNSLGQALVQQPFERFQLAQGLAELQQRNMQSQALNQYRMGLLGLRQNQTDAMQQARDMANQINMLRVQVEMQRNGAKPINTAAGVYFPQGMQMQGPQAQQGGVGMGLPTNNALATAPTGAQQNGYNFVPRPAPQSSPSQTTDAGNAAIRNYLGMQSMTNSIPMDMSNNIVNFTRQAIGGGLPQQQAQQPQGVDTNNIMQQAQQAIQAGADPMAVRQRLQQQYNLTMP